MSEKNLQSSMLDLALRVDRVERQLGLQLERVPSPTFGRQQPAPAPDYSSDLPAEPEPELCSCDEAISLRRQLHEQIACTEQWMQIAWRETKRADDAEFRLLGYRFRTVGDTVEVVKINDDTVKVVKIGACE